MRIVRAAFCAVPLALAAPALAPAFSAAAAQEAPASSLAQAARATIEAQLDAFARGNAAAAFSHASPGIRARFRDSATFMRMVEAGYGALVRPRSVEFLDLTAVHGLPAQRVLVVGQDGVPRVAVYLLEPQTDGPVRLAGCYWEEEREAA